MPLLLVIRGSRRLEVGTDDGDVHERRALAAAVRGQRDDGRRGRHRERAGSRTAGEPSGLVTVTSRAASRAAPETLTLTDSAVALDRVTEFTVTPAPENDTDDTPRRRHEAVPLTVTVEWSRPAA